MSKRVRRAKPNIQCDDAQPEAVVADVDVQPIRLDDLTHEALVPERPKDYSEPELRRILANLDAMTLNLERILSRHRELRRKIAARLETKSGEPTPPPHVGGRVIPMRRRNRSRQDF